MIRLLLADDEDLVRGALATLLDERSHPRRRRRGRVSVHRRFAGRRRARLGLIVYEIDGTNIGCARAELNAGGLAWVAIRGPRSTS